jgi:cytochrome oxidase Cu insertion factor (SCO1/SenC/PrrC family)
MTTVKKLHELQDNAKKHQVPVEIFVITIDPENDTPEKLREFKEAHHADDHWHMLRTDTKTTRKFVTRMGLGEYWQADDHIQHRFQIQILNPKTQATETLDWDHQDVGDFFGRPKFAPAKTN